MILRRRRGIVHARGRFERKGRGRGEAIRSWNLGASNPRQESVAFLWRDGQLDRPWRIERIRRDSRSQGINDQSEVIGWSYPDDEEHPAFRWRDDRMAAIGLEDAYAINNTGQSLGTSIALKGGETISVAVVWKAGQLTELSWTGESLEHQRRR